MKDLSYLDPPIEVAAKSPRLEMIMQRLRTSGMRPYPAGESVNYDHPDPLLIDLETISINELTRCARAQLMDLPRTIAVLKNRGTSPHLSDAIFVNGDSHLYFLASQLDAVARLEAREREHEARRETAALMGVKLETGDPEKSPHLLYIGSGSKLYLSLRGALKSRDIKLTAALSSLTAEDYLKKEMFTAILFDSMGETSDFTGSDRFSSDLNELTTHPVFVLAHRADSKGAAFATEMRSPFEILDADENTEVIADRLASLCLKYLGNKPALPDGTLSSLIMDPVTCLFSREFCLKHLDNQIRIASAREEPLCALTLKFSARAGQPSEDAMRTFANILVRQLRDTDCPALIGASVIGVTLPKTAYRSAVQLSERLAAELVMTDALRGLSISWRVVEKRTYHSAISLLGAGMTGPYAKVIAA